RSSRLWYYHYTTLFRSFSMLFAAGMGIGLVFWGAAEPLTFFATDIKPGMTGEGAELAQKAMAQVFLHWGFHAWAIYVVVGLALADRQSTRLNPSHDSNS